MINEAILIREKLIKCDRRIYAGHLVNWTVVSDPVDQY